MALGSFCCGWVHSLSALAAGARQSARAGVAKLASAGLALTAAGPARTAGRLPRRLSPARLAGCEARLALRLAADLCRWRRDLAESSPFFLAAATAVALRLPARASSRLVPELASASANSLFASLACFLALPGGLLRLLAPALGQPGLLLGGLQLAFGFCEPDARQLDFARSAVVKRSCYAWSVSLIGLVSQPFLGSWFRLSARSGLSCLSASACCSDGARSSRRPGRGRAGRR